MKAPLKKTTAAVLLSGIVVESIHGRSQPHAHAELPLDYALQYGVLRDAVGVTSTSTTTPITSIWSHAR